MWCYEMAEGLWVVAAVWSAAVVSVVLVATYLLIREVGR